MRSADDGHDSESREDGQSSSNSGRNTGGGFGLRGNDLF